MSNSPSKLRVNGSRLWQSIMDLGEIGATAGGGSCRLALSDEDRVGRALFVSWCEAAGCAVTLDNMGNVFARRAGRLDKPPVAIGSHLDTQPHGGKFDGVFGVLAGLEVIRTLNDNDCITDYPIEIIDWTNEEGSRFAPAMLASGVFAELFELDFALSRTDTNGCTVADELQRIGFAGTQVCGHHPLSVFLETHIEQGPILEHHGEIIGVVTGGQGQLWYDVMLRGQDAHVGSTPMIGRRDALVAASNLVQSVQALATQFATDAVGTVGELSVRPNSRNTIPGEVYLTIDLRHPDDTTLRAMDKQLRQQIAKIAQHCAVEIEAKEIWHNPPVVFNETCVAAVQAAADVLGYANRRMVSGAGHDACQLARKVPTAMIFVPCAGGISHNEAESADPAHVEAGANTLLHTALTLSQDV